MDRIMALREQAINAGFDNTYGARHAEAFSNSLEHSGQLDELRLVPNTVGVFNLPVLLNMAPEALRALTHGKLPPIIHKKIENSDRVRKLFRRVEDPDRS